MKFFDFGIKNISRYQELVDTGLKGLVPENISGLKRLLEASGKRLRPSLVIAIAHYNGKPIDDRVITAATAVELVHIASLVHDDIMDDGRLRWGQPTINAKEGVDSAILAGDYLLAKGCALATSVSAEAGKMLAETIADLCEGQARELKDEFNLGRTTESLISAIKGKTSSLFIASCILGGLVSELGASELKVLHDFAENLGIAYQHMDDVSDFVASPEASGKSVGNDIREGKYTLPVILSLRGSSGLILKGLIEQKAPASQILEVLQKDGSIDHTIKEAESYKQKALIELEKLDNTALAGALKSFVDHI